jgi:hypothetical protein
MYTVKVREEVEPRKIEFRCDECGDTNVQTVRVCEWSVEKQAWIATDHYGNDDWCNNCDSETTIDTYFVG